MPSLGNLNVQIGADTSGLQSATQQVTSRLTKLRGTMNRVAAGAAKLGTASAGAGAAIVAGIVKTSSDAITQQARLARSLGTTNKEVAGLTSAFRAYGLEQQDVADAINTISDRAQDAASGMESMAADFRMVGIDVESLKGKKPVQLFRQFASAIQNTQDPTKRTAAAVRIFGDDIGRKLLPLLMEGEGAIDKFTKRAEEMGLAVGEVDATKVEQASIAMSQVRDAVAGLGRTLTVELAPTISAVAEMFTDAAREGNGFGNEIKSVLSGTAQAAGFVVDSVAGIGRVFQSVGDSIIGGWAEIIGFITDKWATLLETINKGAKMVGIDSFEGAADAVRGFSDQAKGVADEAWGAFENNFSQPLPSDAIGNFFSDARAKAEKEAQKLKEKRDAMAALGDTGGNGEGGQSQGDDSEKSEIERLKEKHKTRVELERQLQQQLKAVRTAFDKGEIKTKQKRDAIIRGLEKSHQSQMTSIMSRAEQKRQNFEQASMDTKVSILSSGLKSMTSTLASENRKMFEMNKSAALAEAGMQAISGAIKTFNSYPYPWNLPMTAAHVATSVAKINQLKAKSFSGGAGGGAGGASGGGGGGSAAGSGQQAQSGQAGGGQQTERVIRVQGLGAGDMISGEQLTELLNEANEDGARLVMDR